MKKIAAFVIIFILLIVIKSLAISIYTKITLDNPTTTLNDELLGLRQKNQFLRAQFEYVKTNDFIEQTARRKLGMVQAGEHIIIAPLASAAAQEKAPESKPNWEKWLRLFF